MSEIDYHILERRIEDLEINLDRIEKFFELADDRRKNIQNLLDQVNGAGKFIKDLLTKISLLEIKINDLTNVDEKIIEDLTQVQDLAKDARTAVKSSKEIAENIKDQLIPVGNDFKSLRTDIESSIKDCKGVYKELVYSENKGLNKCKLLVENAKATKDEINKNSIMENAWIEYEKNYKKSLPIFTAYVDFVRGIALRDSGFDDGISQIADELISTSRVKSVEWDSLSIPALHETVEENLAMIIRLGFPEWTIWALPLTGFQFGKEIAGKNQNINKLIGSYNLDGKEKLRYHEYIADAFATYSMGPSYACVTILMKLNPRTSDSINASSDLKRAYVILSMLERMDEAYLKKFNTSPYYDIIRNLRKEWEQAILESNKGRDISNEEKEELNKLIDDILEQFFNEVSSSYTGDSWFNYVQGWKTQLFKMIKEKGKNIEDYIKVDGTEDLRNVSNVAWYCRLIDPSKKGDIERCAYQLFSAISKRKNPGVRHKQTRIPSRYQAVSRMEPKR